MDDKPGRLPKSIWWLNVTQFLGALNDNAFKLLVIFFLAHLHGEGHRAAIMANASIAFVLPFLLFTHASGVLADRFSKRNILVWAKFLEIGVMSLGLAAIAGGQAVPDFVFYGLIFLMCVQSAMFGPSKYGIVPELVTPDLLSRANSYLVGLTYLAVILGTLFPSLFLDKVWTGNHRAVAAVCLGIAVAGTAVSVRISKTPAAGEKRAFTPLFVVDIFKTLGKISKDKYLLLSVLGAVYFTFIGSFMQMNLFLYGESVLGLEFDRGGYLFALAALGIGAGAFLSGKVSGRNIEFGVIPIGALGLTSCGIAFGAAHRLPAVLTVIFLTGVSAGLYIVPLNAFIQYRTPGKRLGEILACQSFLSFLGVGAAAGIWRGLTEGMGLSPGECFVVAGMLTGLLAGAALWILPDFFVRFLILCAARLFYRIRAFGRENVPIEGPALLVSNHVTWVDAMMIASTQQRRVRFMIGREIYESRWMKPLFRLMRAIPLSPRDGPRKTVEALRAARKALDDGALVCVFAEGAMTRNGNMRGFRPGLQHIVKGTDYPVIPVHIGGAWGSIFSYYGGRILFKRPGVIPYPVTVIFGKALPSSADRDTIRRSVMELSGLSFDLRKNTRRTLAFRLVHSARKHWFRPALADTTGKKLNFGQTLTGAIALSRRIHAMSPGQENVGVLLPASVGGALTNIAVTLLGKTPVNLNFTSPLKSIKSAIDQCGIRTIISSRAFVEKFAQLEELNGIEYLEDIAAQITVTRKIRASLSAVFSPAGSLMKYRRPGPDDTAVIIFSSGSTGEPKGVMLSHHNIISNIESFRMVYNFDTGDRMCGVLPFFHSFGFTTTLWCPLITGFSAVYHPNPLDGSKVGEIARENRLTIVLATPTFLLSYIRRAKPGDFDSVRKLIAGAEKLPGRIADAFEEKFGVRPLEGYGATELSPVANVNVPDAAAGTVSQTGNKEGSIGHPVPGVTMKIVEPETGQPLETGREGLLMVKGPNVMLGYLGKPEKTAEVIRNGWYNTGDIAYMDEDGFVFLLDRMSRYSKIGGEMVPHMALEEKIMDALGGADRVAAVTSAPDKKKGEQLVVLYLEEAVSVDRIREIVEKSDLPNLWKPRKGNYCPVREMPVLGSGKLDLKRLKAAAAQFVNTRPGPMSKALDRLRDSL
ncbi:MAG: acyl-[ACP]--phospholipid O-acyltransferase [Kiritimatiellia bacterium]